MKVKTSARLADKPKPASTAKAPWAWAGAGMALGLLLALVLLAPARWLAFAAAHFSKQHVLLDQPRGSLWIGSARLLLSAGADSHDRMALPGRIQWKIRPAGARLTVQIMASCCMDAPLDMHWQPRLDGFQLQVSDHVSHWPADLLTGLGTPWNTLALEGRLQLQTHDLTLSGQPLQLSADSRVELQARDMSSRLSTLRPLGSWQLQLQGGPSLRLQLETLDGPLLLSGQGQWQNGRLRFRGEAGAADGMQDSLANLLNIIGRRQGDIALIAFDAG